MTDYAVIVTWPQYSIGTSLGRVSGLGHAGVIIFSGATGDTNYFEYGRYDRDVNDTAQGNVRPQTVPNLTIDDNGISQQSLIAAISHLSVVAGKNNVAMASVLELSEGGYKSSLKFATDALRNPSEAYGNYSVFIGDGDFNEKTCYAFAKAVAAAGGSWVEWKDGFSIFDNVPSAGMIQLISNNGGFIVGGPNGDVFFSPGGFPETIVPATKCFPAHTRIQTSRTTSTAISALRVGDLVLAFDARAGKGRGALVPRRVTRLYRNTTTEWIRLRWFDGTAREVITTPKPYVLDLSGQIPVAPEVTRTGRRTRVGRNRPLKRCGMRWVDTLPVARRDCSAAFR